MITDTEALARRAHHSAEGDVLDVQGFIDLLAEGGVQRHRRCAWPGELLGERVGDLVVWMGGVLADAHRELHRVKLGDVVVIEVSIRGTFLGPSEKPVGLIHPTGDKVDFPTADSWYVRDGS